MKKIHGVYLTKTEAKKEVDELLKEGFTKDQIEVICDSDLGKDLDYLDNPDKEKDTSKDNENLWEKIKDSFTFKKYGDEEWNKNIDMEERKLLEGYRTNLEAGETVILIKDTTTFNEYFKDGAPDWDEREEEFNKNLD